MYLKDYLKSIGYKPYAYDFNKQEYCIPVERDNFFSSYGPLDIMYKSEDSDITFVWGLNEYKHGATLISPRPKFIRGNFDSAVYEAVLDSDMDRLFAMYTGEEIYKSIVTNKPLIYDRVEEGDN